MSEVFCGPTAFKLHRIPPQVIGLCPPFPQPRGDKNRTELRSHPVVREILGTPLHRLVFSRNELSNGKLFRDHFWSGECPFGSIWEHELGASVTSPAMTLLGLASAITFPQLLMAVYEMCGGFAVFRPSEAIEEALRKYWHGGSERLGFWKRVMSTKGAPTSLWMRPPLLDLDELKRFASEVAGHRGARPLAEAAELMTGVCDSPFEVQTSLLLGLPRRLGGMGFTDIENNKVIRLSSEARSLCGKSECRADVYLGARDSARPVDIECQGAVVHDSGESAISDSRRIAALQSMGIDVVPVTFDQISDARSFDALAALVAKRSGRRLAPKTKGLQRRELDLRRNVLIDWNTLGE